MFRPFIFIFLLIAVFSCNKVEEANFKEMIVYQIYPRSFKDSDGDGVGDIKGIIEKLDYIESLGVTAVWLNPIYQSPNFDNGYDVSDYRGISPEYGTMEDFDLLVSEMHKRNLKLVMDIVVNHSSHEHEWFKQSRSSRNNPYREYYHWWPAEKGKPPYRYSLFDPKGDAWEYDSLTNAYYLHYFAEQQPDLNWSNPKLQKEVVDVLAFWAEKGVDGFRLDAFGFAAKDTSFPEFPKGYEKEFMKYYSMQPGIHDYLKLMNKEVFSKYHVFSVAEGAGNSFEDAHQLVDEDRKELSMAYPFDGVDLPKRKDFNLKLFKETYSKWDMEFAEKGWLSIFLSNHDQSRMVSRFADDSEEFRASATKMLNTFILSMRGTPYAYYGDELGMTNIYFNSIDQYNDISAKNGYKKIEEEGGDLQAFLDDQKKFGRDNGRTPMQWDSSVFAGFSTAKPWLPVNQNKSIVNVEAENANSTSVLNHFRALTKLRKENPVLIYGKYTLLDLENPSVYAYTREWKGEKVLVLLNFTKKPANFNANGINLGKIWINNYSNLNLKGSQIVLEPYQALIIQVK